MRKTFLIIDSNYLCWRAFYAMGHLAYEGNSTGVIFGFLKDIVSLFNTHCTKDIVFCFDSPMSKRKKILPLYKANRGKWSVDEAARINQENMFKQIKRLRDEILPDIGFKNVFSQGGYEADDLIAQFAGQLDYGKRGIIVSPDADFYQILKGSDESPKVWIWNVREKRSYTRESLEKEYGVTPDMWPKVLAIAGCRTDNIPGVASGIGLKIAANYVSGRMKQGKGVDRIEEIERSWDIVERNLRLVSLPFKGTKEVVIQGDEISQSKWRSVLKNLGFRSMKRELI